MLTISFEERDGQVFQCSGMISVWECRLTHHLMPFHGFSEIARQLAKDRRAFRVSSWKLFQNALVRGNRVFEIGEIFGSFVPGMERRGQVAQVSK